MPQKTLNLTPHPSSRLALAMALGYLMPLAFVLACPLSWLVKIVLGLSVLAALAASLREHVFRYGLAILRARRETDGGWLLESFDGREQRATLAEGSTVLPWLTVLRFRLASGRSSSLILLADGIAPEEFRQLRILLLNPPAGSPRDPQFA